MICPHCKQSVDPSTAVKYKSKSYHPECLQAIKEKARQKDAATSRKLNDPALKALSDYLCELFSIPSLTPLLVKQINDLHSEYSYEDILLSVKHFFTYGEGAHQDRSGEKPSIGIVPYIVDEAKSFMLVMKEAVAATSAVPDGQQLTVRIKQPDLTMPSRWSIDDM